MTTFSKRLKHLIGSVITINMKGDTYYVYYKFKDPSPADYFTIRKKVVSYHPNGERQEFNDDGTWKRDGRREMRLSQFISKHLSLSFSCDFMPDSDIDIEKCTAR